MDKELLEDQLNQMEEMIEEVFDLQKEDLDLKYLGALIDDFKVLGGNPSKYEKRYLKELNSN